MVYYSLEEESHFSMEIWAYCCTRSSWYLVRSFLLCRCYSFVNCSTKDNTNHHCWWTCKRRASPNSYTDSYANPNWHTDPHTHPDPCLYCSHYHLYPTYAIASDSDQSPARQ